MAREDLENEELALRIEKLRVEIDHAVRPFYRTPATFIAIVAAGVTFVGTVGQCTRIGIEKEKQAVEADKKILESSQKLGEAEKKLGEAEKKQSGLIAGREKLLKENDELLNQRKLHKEEIEESQRKNGELRSEFAQLQGELAKVRIELATEQQKLASTVDKLKSTGQADAVQAAEVLAEAKSVIGDKVAELEDRAAVAARAEPSEGDEDNVDNLLRLINSPVRTTRRTAVARICREYTRTTEDLSRYVAELELPRLEKFNTNGRINLLEILTEAPDKLWTPDLRVRVAAALKVIEERDKQGIVATGPMTTKSIADLRSKLKIQN